MGASVDKDLQSLLQYYGENTENTETMKPEDFFGLITSFALALDVCQRSSLSFEKLAELLFHRKLRLK